MTAVEHRGRWYLAPSARPDGCRIASLIRSGRVSSLMTADCGWTTRVPSGDFRYLDEAVARWAGHDCGEAQR